MDFWKGKIAVVTGASAGLGAAIVVDLAKHGITTIGLARRKERVDEIAKKHSNLPGKIIAGECDVSCIHSIKKSFEWVETTFGGIDILINNAGTFRESRCLDPIDNTEDMKNVIDTNFTGAVVAAKLAYLSMAKRDTYGYIINMNSVNGHTTAVPFTMNVYTPTKWAMTALTDTLRRETNQLKNRKVRISSISPGCVKTEIHLAAGSSGDFFDVVPHLTPQDISNQVIYLLSQPPNVYVSAFISILRKILIYFCISTFKDSRIDSSSRRRRALNNCRKSKNFFALVNLDKFYNKSVTTPTTFNKF